MELSELQKVFLKEFAKTRYSDIFYLSAGTALSYYYLKHRISDDLDFFTKEDEIPIEIVYTLYDISKNMNKDFEFKKVTRSYICFYLKHIQPLRVDFIKEDYKHTGEIFFDNKLGIYYDNIEEIGAKKLISVVEREDIKDFIDLYFLEKETNIKIVNLYGKTKEKGAFINPVDLLEAFTKIEKFKKLPRMKKDVTLEEIYNFFHKKITEFAKIIKEK